MAESAGYDVFLSYNSQDRKVVQRIGRELEKRGIRVWADWKMPSGSVWLTELEKIIRQVEVAAFFVGPNGLGEWHDNERQAFHIRRARIIPVLLPGAPADFEPPLFLHRHSWIDFRTPGKISRKELDRLVEGIRAEAGAAEVEEEAVRAPVAPAPIPAASGRWTPSRRAVVLALLVLALLVAGGGAWLAMRARSQEAAERSAPARPSRWKAKVPLPRPSVAVLSFENRASGGELDWLGTALPEVVSAKLGMGGAVRAANREDVSFVEADLLLPRKSEIAAKDLARIHSALGVDYVVGGGYSPVGGTSTVRLDLALYDAVKGRSLAAASGTGEVSAWFELADRTSEGASRKESFRQRLETEPLTLDQKRSLRTLFPTSLPAATRYAQGLERYRRFDARSAADLLAQAAKLEPHPLALGGLAQAEHFLGRSREAAAAAGAAKRLADSRKLPGEHGRAIELIARQVALDPGGVSETAEALFREYFPDDLSYGLLAVEKMVDAGSAEDALLMIDELRGLPSAGEHPGLQLAEAEALYALQRYGQARTSAEAAIGKAQAIGAVRQESSARLALGTIFLMLGEAAKTEKQLLSARSGFERTGDLLGVAQCIEQRAFLYQKLDLEAAEGLFGEAIERYEALGDRKEKARALFGLSRVLALKGQEAEAQERSREASSLAAESSSSFNEGLVELNTGGSLHLAGKLDAAQARYETARVILDKVNQRDWYAVALTNLGEIEYARGRLANAEGLHRQAVEIHEAIGAVEAAAYDNIGLGRVLEAGGNYFAARQRYELALRSLRPAEGDSPKEPETLAEALLALSELELHSGKPSKAEQAAREAGEIAGGAGQGAMRSRALALLARALVDQGKVDEARRLATEAAGLARGDFRAEREAGIAAARARAAAGEVEPALEMLAAIAESAGKEGLAVYEMEALLAAGEIEVRDGRIAGRQHLKDLQARATALGFGQIQKRVEGILAS